MLKALSLGYVLSLFVLLVEYGAPGTVLPTAIYLLVPIAAVWFPQELGGWLGPHGLGWIRVTRPALLVHRIGWILLFLAPLVPLAFGG